MANYDLTQTGAEVQSYLDSVPYIDVTGTQSGSVIVFSTSPYAQVAENYAAGCGSIVRVTVGTDIYAIPITGYDGTNYMGSLTTGDKNIVATINSSDASATIIDLPDVINDMTTGGTDDALSAEQGKILNNQMQTMEDDIQSIEQSISSIQPIIIEGNVTNAPDEEDITTDSNDLLKFANRNTLHGMGYVIMRRGTSFAEQLTMTNTIYEIRYNFDLNDANGDNPITIPSGCTLFFNGGILTNGTLTGQNTFISGTTDLSGVTLSGSFANKSFSLYDAGCTPNDTSAASNNATRILAFIQSLENIKNTLIVPDGNWYFDTPLVLSGNFCLKCEGMLVYKTDNSNVLTTALTIGNTNSGTSNNHIIKITQNSSYQFTSTIIDNIGLRLVNVNSSEITIHNATNFVYGVIIEANGIGSAYNTYNLGRLGWGNCYCPLKIQPIDSNGWINENLFIGGAIHNQGSNVYYNSMVGLWVESSSTHKANNNIFIKPCLEGAEVGVKFVNALQNSVYDMRDEGVSTIQQSTDCHGNFISRYSGLSNFQTITANTFEKFNITRQHVFSARTSFARYQIGSTWYASAVQLDVATYGSNTNIGHDIKLYGALAYTGKIVDTSNAKCFSVCLKNAGRCAIVCYDANDNVISPSSLSDVIVKNTYLAVSGDGHTISAQSDSTYADFEFTSAVKRAFIGCDSAKSKYIEVYAYTANRYGEFGISIGLNKCTDLATATTINAEVGDILLNGDGLPIMWNGEKWVSLDGYPVNVLHKGTTAQRPTNLLTYEDMGFAYFDTDLIKEIYANYFKSQIAQITAAKQVGSGVPSQESHQNPLNGNSLYYVGYNKQQSWGGKLIFRKTNSTNTSETDDIVILANFNNPAKGTWFTSPDPTEYPYIYTQNSYSVAEIITFYEPTVYWIENDGATAGVLRNGTTANRPTSTEIYVGFEYFDETLGKPIYWNGSAWIDATGTSV